MYIVSFSSDKKCNGDTKQVLGPTAFGTSCLFTEGSTGKQSSLVTLETGSSKGLSGTLQSSKHVFQQACANREISSS